MARPAETDRAGLRSPKRRKTAINAISHDCRNRPADRRIRNAGAPISIWVYPTRHRPALPQSANEGVGAVPLFVLVLAHRIIRFLTLSDLHSALEVVIAHRIGQKIDADHIPMREP